MPGKPKLTHKQVREYFKSIEPEMAELVLDLVRSDLVEHAKYKAEVSARLSKARAAKGKKPRTAAAPQANDVVELPPQADPQVQREVAEAIPVPQRRASGR